MLSATENEAVEQSVAGQIRLLRERQKLSQRALAQEIGVSRNTLSLIERGQTSPTLATLQKIADGLNVDIGSFFGHNFRQVQVYEKVSGDSNVSDRRLSVGQDNIGIDGLISALILRLEPNAKCGSLLPHSGEEFVYCLSGRCLFSVDGERYMLESGDSLRFDGRLPHYCQNPGQGTTKALVIFLDMIHG